MEDRRDYYPETITLASMFQRYVELPAQELLDGHPVVVDSKAGRIVQMSAAEYPSNRQRLDTFTGEFDEDCGSVLTNELRGLRKLGRT